MNTGADSIRYGLDRLVANDNRVFAWGWIAHELLNVVSVDLVADADGRRLHIAATCGLARDDVAAAFPAVPGALTSGFTVTGFLNQAASSSFSIEARLSDGSVVALPAHPTALVTSPARTRSWYSSIRSAWRRLAVGDIRGLMARLHDHALTAGDFDVSAFRTAIKRAGASSIVVVIDHDMGGGANTYRRDLIAQLHAEGKGVVLFTAQLPSLDYRIRLLPPKGDEAIFRTDHLLSLELLVDAIGPCPVIVNSPVSFDDPLLLAEWLARARTDGRIGELIATAHDHFAICPSFVLLDADGRYCGVPDMAICANCLPRHRAPFMTLSPPTAIPAWRASWLRCLLAADEVRCFSESTRQLLTRAFPALMPDRLTVAPHKLNFDTSQRPRIDPLSPLVIGIVGHIGFYKGAKIVAEMVALADASNLPVRFVVFGTLEIKVDSSRLTVTGAYQRQALAGLIERYGANVFAFPSICPETFSYVVEELIAMNVPIVGFDLGAQGEKLARYAMGRLCPLVDAGRLLDMAQTLHADYARTMRGNSQLELQ